METKNKLGVIGKLKRFSMNNIQLLRIRGGDNPPPPPPSESQPAPNFPKPK